MTAYRPTPTTWTRSAAIAGWYTLHVLVGGALLRVALGDFVNGDSAGGDFHMASMSQVMAPLSIPLHPALAFALQAVALTGAAHAAALLWRRMLHTLAAEELDALTAAGLAWSLKQQFFSAWLLVAAGLTSAALLSMYLESPPVLLGLFMFCWFALPVLVWRPRWLHASHPNKLWLPSGAALGAYVVTALAWSGLKTGLEQVGSDVFQWLVLGLALAVTALQASMLICVGHRSEIIPHLASRWQHRFWLMHLLAAFQLFRALVKWVLPTVQLIAIYGIFIAPAVAHLAPHLPELGVTMHKLAMHALDWWVNHWWAIIVPCTSVWMYLYIGRCMVLFDEHRGAAG